MRKLFLLTVFMAVIHQVEAQTASARYWFDNDVTTMHAGVACSGAIDLDISCLNVGLHAVHYQKFDEEGVPSSVRTRYFMVDQIQKGTLSAKIWFDTAEDAAETYTLTDEDIVLDVSDLEIGTHEVSVALYDAQGAYVGTQTVEFEVPIPMTTITLSAAGKGTFCWNVDLDFADVEGLKAYIATGYNMKTGKVTMGRVTDVPAGTGVMLCGAQGTYQVPQMESYSYYVNLLIGTTEATIVSGYDGGFANYTLQNGTSGIGFYLKNGTVAAGKAYLHVPRLQTNDAKMLGIVLEEEEDAMSIGNVPVDGFSVGSPTYNLMGMPVERPQAKGVYIRNRKKIIIH